MLPKNEKQGIMQIDRKSLSGRYKRSVWVVGKGMHLRKKKKEGGKEGRALGSAKKRESTIRTRRKGRDQMGNDEPGGRGPVLCSNLNWHESRKVTKRFSGGKSKKKLKQLWKKPGKADSSSRG